MFGHISFVHGPLGWMMSSREIKVIKAVGVISSKSENIKLLYLKGRVRRVHPE